MCPSQPRPHQEDHSREHPVVIELSPTHFPVSPPATLSSDPTVSFRPARRHFLVSCFCVSSPKLRLLPTLPSVHLVHLERGSISFIKGELEEELKWKL